METYVKPQPEVIAENKLAATIIRTKERYQRILYLVLGAGIILIGVGFISFLMK
jgi:hypothetical protein